MAPRGKGKEERLDYCYYSCLLARISTEFLWDMRASVVYLKLYYTTERKRRGKDAIALPTLGAARPQVGQEHPCSAVGDFQLFFFVVLQYNFHGFVSCGIFHHAGKLIRSNEKVDYYFS